MSHSDLKLYILNSTSFILSFSNIENTLKIILLLASIFYTLLKVVETLKGKKNDNKIDKDNGQTNA
jgi:uncharacterized membrane protein YesL